MINSAPMRFILGPLERADNRRFFGEERSRNAVPPAGCTDDAGASASEWLDSPIAAAALRHAVYVAIHLAIGAVIQAIGP